MIATYAHPICPQPKAIITITTSLTIITIITIIIVTSIITVIAIITATKGRQEQDGADGPWPGPLRRGGPEAVVLGRGDATAGDPRRARISRFEPFELILLSKLDKQLSIERFEPTVSQSTVS